MIKIKAGAIAVCSIFMHAVTAEPNTSFSPYVDKKQATQVFWGDTHLHSELSTDAMGFGVTLGPDHAYRFAKGETVTTSGGLPVRLSRPLDFIVLADHAESLGVMSMVKAGDERVLGNDTTKRWNKLLNGSIEQAAEMRSAFFNRKGRKAAVKILESLSDEALQQDIWRSAVNIADHHYQPGVFTPLLGFEWTSVPGGSNLHRVVMFRDGAKKVNQVRPLSSAQGDDPLDLWRYMAAYEKNSQGQVLAIAHNGNLSNGLMFPTTERLHGWAVDLEYQKLRAKWEPVYEATQIKGDGETHPLLSPDDAFADYETWDLGNMAGVPKTPEMLPQEYARSGLLNGLQLEAKSGVNPYQFGLIGSTDSHTALAAVEENNFFGKHSGVEPNAKRWGHLVGKAAEKLVKGWQQASSGYAAVWATENTRESLFDAIHRREVYATTGPRMTVRLFGGWHFNDRDQYTSDIAQLGYAKGVPMGSVLSAAKGKSPSFLVSASKDSIGANLDRVQIIKGWVDSKGQTHEKVINIAWSGDRKLDKEGKLPSVGNTVDVANATWQNSIGATQLTSHWTDPDFDPKQAAFYYVRVIEIPTPRWTAYDQKRFATKMADNVPMTTTERAYTSPIWYKPNSNK